MRRSCVAAGALLCVALLLSGCGGGGNSQAYPIDAITGFTAGCESGLASTLTPTQAADACSCMVKQMEANVPLEDFIALSAEYARGASPAPTKQIVADAKACGRKLPGPHPVGVATPPASAAAGADATWPAGTKLAPDFRLVDQSGKPVSLARFRGRPVLLTFIDPLCRNLCPLETKVLDRVAASFPVGQRPAIVAVSVNQWADSRRDLLQAVQKWSLPSDWYWAVGPAATLKKVWAAYGIGVQASVKAISGITVHNITYTEAAYLIDAHGNQRALYLYPFHAPNVVRTLRSFAHA